MILFHEGIHKKTLILIIFFNVSILQGCAVIGVLQFEDMDEQIENPIVELFSRSNNGGEFIIQAENKLDLMTSNLLFSILGAPNEHTCEADKIETWIYHGDSHHYSGFIIALFIPIPLIYPSGTDEVRFKIQNNQVLVLEQLEMAVTFAVCLLCPLGQVMKANVIQSLNIEHLIFHIKRNLLKKLMLDI